MTIQAKTAVPSAATNGKNGHSLISDAKFRQLYSLALRLQLLAEDATGLGPAGARLRRHAAALAGIAADVREGDSIVAGYPAPAWDILRGELRVNVALDAGDTVADKVAAAAADRLRRNSRVTLLLFSANGAENILGETHALANDARLPVIFVEEGSAEMKRKGGGSAHAAMPAIPVDAHDVIATYRVAHESIARAREGSGPTRIVCLEAPLAAGHSADAVADLEGWLEARGLPAHEWRQAILAAAQSRKTA